MTQRIFVSSVQKELPRNPLIAEFLFLAHYAEKAGSCILDMFELCRKAGLPEPQFRQEGGQFIQTLRLPASFEEAHVEAHEAHVEAHEELTATERALLSACAETPRSPKELLLAAGYAARSGNFKRSMDRLMESGHIEMLLPGKPRSRLQKYRITEKDKTWLDQDSARSRKN